MYKSLIITLFLFAAPLSAETKVLAFSGSTRKESCNQKLIKYSAEVARKMGANVTVINLKDYPLPFYDADLETEQGMPENAKQLRKMMMESKKIIIASPEYNGSLSGVLKNVIDWTSRSEDGKPSRDAFLGKKFAIMSCSPGAGGGAKGLEHLRAIIQNIGGEVIAKQMAIPNSYTLFNPQGDIENASVKQEVSDELKQLLAE